MRQYWLSELESQGKRRYRVQILRKGSWYHPQAANRELVVDDRLLDEVVQRFQMGVFGNELPVNLGHTDDSTDSKGWVRRVYRQGDALYADIDIVDNDVDDRVAEKRLKYASAELVFNWLDPESRQRVNALRAVALTNRPYIKGMQPIEPLNLSEFPMEANLMNETPVTLSTEEYVQLQERLERLEMLERRVEELTHAAEGLAQVHADTQREAMLSEYRSDIPPAILRLFEMAFRHADRGDVTLGELREHAPEETIQQLNLSENAPTERAMMQDILYVLLHELGNLMAFNRPNSSDARVAPFTHETRGDQTERILSRAREYAQQHNVDLGEAVKRVMRQQTYPLRGGEFA